jgi:hypothetical protein
MNGGGATKSSNTFPFIPLVVVALVSGTKLIRVVSGASLVFLAFLGALPYVRQRTECCGQNRLV